MDFANLARERRSVRGFENRPVPRAAVDAMLEAAVQAPSGGNCQPWHFYAIGDVDILKSLNRRAYQAPWFGTAPVVIVVCAEAERSAARFGERGRELYCLQDTAAAIQNLLLSARSQGLDTCWCGAFDEDAVRDILKLPANLRPVAMIPTGYAAQDVPKRPRRPMEEVVTYLGI